MYDNDKKMIMIMLDINIYMFLLWYENCLFLCSLINLILDVYVLNLLLFRFLMNVGFLETLGN